MEFEEKLNLSDINETKLQKKFKSTLPDYIELKYFKSNISNSFLEMNLRFSDYKSIINIIFINFIF